MRVFSPFDRSVNGNFLGLASGESVRFDSQLRRVSRRRMDSAYAGI